MTQEDMDRALADALAAEPSPEFVARVRAQVAATPMSAPWHRWWPAAAAGVVAIALFVAVGLETDDGAARQSAGPSLVASDGRPAIFAAQAPSTTRVEQVPAVAAGSRIAKRRIAKPQSPPHAFPEVLISPDDAGTVRLLLASAQEGVSPLAVSRPTDQPMTVSQIDLPLIEVAPLAKLTQLEPGERQ